MNYHDRAQRIIAAIYAFGWRPLVNPMIPADGTILHSLDDRARPRRAELCHFFAEQLADSAEEARRALKPGKSRRF